MKTLLVIALLAFLPASAAAQQKTATYDPNAPLTAAEEKLIFFPTMEACVAAYESGEYLGYIPHPKNQRPLPVGAVTLPTAICADEDVREFSGGNRAVVVLENVPVDLENGEPVMDARCRNKIHRSVRLPLRRGLQGPPGPPGKDGRAGTNGRDGLSCWDTNGDGFPDLSEDKNHDGKWDADDCVKTVVVATPQAAPAFILPPASDDASNWGLTGSVMLGTFSSMPINSFVSGLAGRNVCDVKGHTFGGGLAWRPDEDSWLIVRFTAEGKTIKDGSYTQCKECNLTRVAYNMKAWGGQIEAVGKFTDWPIKPMASLNLGAGHVTGLAFEFVGAAGTIPPSARTVGARELFGNDWLAFAGAGLGVAIDQGSNITWGITAVGLEFPGRYFGKVSFTKFW